MGTTPGIYLDLQFPDPPPGRPYVYCNMVSSLDGKVVVDGTERGLGSSADRGAMRELRLHADAVINGAGTLRASGASPRLPDDLAALRLAAGRTRYPLAVVVSASADLPLDQPFFRDGSFHAAVFVREDAPAERLGRLRATGRRVVALPAEGFVGAVLAALRGDFGVRHLLCEGGPRLNRALLDAGALDELFLTLTPKIVGGEGLTAVHGGGPYPRAALPRFGLVSVRPWPETGECFLRYRYERRDG